MKNNLYCLKLIFMLFFIKNSKFLTFYYYIHLQIRSVKQLIYTLLLLFLAQTSSFAQDIHWSQFNDNPIFQNPANSGRFNGQYRFYANYRDQWRSVTVPFQTFSVSADTKIEKVRGLGLGMLLFHDVAGDGRFRTVELQVSPSYNLKLNDDSTHNIRFGVQLGMNHRQMIFNNYYWDDQYDGEKFNPGLATNETFETHKKTNFSTGVGIVYEWSVNDRKRIALGVGAYNLNTPNQGFMGEVIPRERRYNVFAQGQFKIHHDWDILPTFQLNFQGTYNELIFGYNFRYIFKERLDQYVAFYFGNFYRNKDSGYISVGADYKNWFAGISYDMNFSKLKTASKVRGGIEFSLRYIINRTKVNNVIFHRVCPDYI